MVVLEALSVNMTLHTLNASVVYVRISLYTDHGEICT